MKSSKKTKTEKLSQGTTRRSFLQTAMAGGALASTAYLGLTRDVFAKETGPIVIGHHAEHTERTECLPTQQLLNPVPDQGSGRGLSAERTSLSQVLGRRGQGADLRRPRALAGEKAA